MQIVRSLGPAAIARLMSLDEQERAEPPKWLEFRGDSRSAVEDWPEGYGSLKLRLIST